MRTFTTLAVAASIFSAQAIQLAEPRDESQPLRVVQHEIQRRHVSNPIQRDRERMQKRASGTVTATLDNEETLYFINATLGTPAQSFRLHIDTGSSDLWVNVANSHLCQEQGNTCALSGTYSANSSSSYRYINSDFNISYLDGSGSTGDYASDTFSFGGVSLENQQFGIGYTSSSEQGILGIGYAINEVAVAYNGNDAYPNVPLHMMQNGLINSNAYSLFLNDLDASTGSILFGGVNSAKYHGELQSLPIIKEQGVYAEFIIALTGVGINGTQGSIKNNIAVPALLDSGSSLMYLPNNITQEIYNAVGASYDNNTGVAIVDCNLATSGWTFDLTFSSPTISVGIDELVILAEESHGKSTCILGIAPAGDTTPILGDTFLRSAYVVYDLTSNEISLAQTNFNSTTDNIQEITNSTGVPGASQVTNAVTSVAVASGGAREPTAGFTKTLNAAAQPTAATGYNLALLGAAGAAGFAFAL